MTDSLLYLSSWLVMHVTPFAAFAVGVGISVHLQLNSNLSARAVWMMALPVAMVTIGNFMHITYIETTVHNAAYPETIPEFTYMKSFPNFLVFAGTLMFYGTAVPKLFEGFRARIIGTPPTTPVAPTARKARPTAATPPPVGSTGSPR